jgi:hypothetical protein
MNALSESTHPPQLASYQLKQRPHSIINSYRIHSSYTGCEQPEVTLKIEVIIIIIIIISVSEAVCEHDNAIVASIDVERAYEVNTSGDIGTLELTLHSRPVIWVAEGGIGVVSPEVTERVMGQTKQGFLDIGDFGDKQVVTNIPKVIDVHERGKGRLAPHVYQRQHKQTQASCCWLSKKKKRKTWN